MRRVIMASMLLGLLIAVVAVAPAVAGTRTSVHMEVTTIFDPDPDEFWASGITGCASGFVTDGPAILQFTPAPGIFAGYKVFDCGGGTGFVVRLNARFGPDGAVGTWSVVDAWGAVDGMQGAGKLVGEPIAGGILDIYDGVVTR